MRGRRWMDHKRLCVTDICKITCKTEIIDELTGVLDIALYAEAQDATKSIRSQEFLRTFMVFVTGETKIRDPRNFGVIR